jgi:hypothetical protein
MKVKLLTLEQKENLSGNYFKENIPFCFLKDDENNFVLALEIVAQITNPDFLWVKALPEIDFNGNGYNLISF